MKNLVFLIILAATVYSCIPIEDKINPNIHGLDISRSYYYQDTIKFSAIFVDNNGLDSGKIVIDKFPIETATEVAWSHIDTFDIAGRRAEPSFEIVIPKYKELGSYLITLYGFDEGGNPDTVKRFFELKADQTKPEIHDLKIGLPQDTDGNYKACRSEVLEIEGLATDNLIVNKVGFSWGGSKANLTFYSGDTVQLASVFQNKLTVPKNFPADTLISLNIIAVDSFNNTIRTSVPIKIDCDDISPSFQLIKSRPRVNLNNRTFVTQGGSLTIKEMEVSDNRFVETVQVYYNKFGESLALHDEVELKTSETTDITEFMELDFEVPLSANIGDIYEISFLASDSSGNKSELYTIQSIVIEDKAPLITITDTYIDNIDKPFVEDGYTSIKAGQSVTFKGKVEEENALSSLTIYWFDTDLSPEIYLQRERFTDLPVNLSNYHNQSSFVIPASAQAGDIFELKIYAVDSKGQDSEVIYFFLVEN